MIIELKTQPDREMVFQAADYWRKIELQRRRGILHEADLFDGREILDKPALIYLAAPAWSFHRDFEFFAQTVAPEIELWRFELHENWRENVKVLARHGLRRHIRFNKAIADAADGLDNLRVVWLVLEVFAEADDEVVDRAGVGVFLQVPDLFEDGLSRDGPAFVFDEVLQEFCLHQRELDGLVAVS